MDDVCENGRWHACHVCHGEHKACETACGQPKRKSEAQSSGAAWLGEGSGDGSGEERSDWGGLRTPPPQQSKDRQIVLAAAKVVMAAAGSSAFTTQGQGPTRAGAAAAAAGPKPPKQAPKAPKPEAKFLHRYLYIYIPVWGRRHEAAAIESAAAGLCPAFNGVPDHS